MKKIYIIMESFKEGEWKGYINSVMDSREKAERRIKWMEEDYKKDERMKGEYYKTWIEERLVE